VTKYNNKENVVDISHTLTPFWLLKSVLRQWTAMLTC